MATREPESEVSVIREIVSLLAVLSLVTLLVAACVVAPVVVAILVNPWVGLPVAVGSFWVWSRFGPPPMPGFLSGILCLWGHAAILGSLVVCVLLAVRR